MVCCIVEMKRCLVVGSAGTGRWYNNHLRSLISPDFDEPKFKIIDTTHASNNARSDPDIESLLICTSRVIVCCGVSVNSNSALVIEPSVALKFVLVNSSNVDILVV